MKLTREQLQKIIQEELAVAIEEGELEEGFLDRLLGKTEPKDISKSPMDLRRKLDNAKKALNDLAESALSQNEQNIAELAKQLLERLKSQAFTKIGLQLRDPQKNVQDFDLLGRGPKEE